MKFVPVLVGALVGALVANPALAAPGGPIDTIHRGAYICALPGDATGPAGFAVPGEDFAVLNGSSYATAEGRGAYLLTGDTLIMTSGPKRGQKFNRLSANFLRKLAPDGSESTLRCVRRSEG